MAPSQEAQFARTLCGFPFGKATLHVLTLKLAEKYAYGNWTEEKVKATAKKFDADPDSPICLVRGGVQSFATEKGDRPGLYREIKRTLEKKGGSLEQFGHKLHGFHTARPLPKAQGKWLNPDLLFRRDLRANAAKTENIHSLEIEPANGFSVASVYQAYEQGRGADFAWVFYVGLKRAHKVANGVFEANADDLAMRRIVLAARDVGVGIVHADIPTAVTSWSVIVRAKERHPSHAERDDLKLRCKIAFEFDLDELDR